LLADGYNGLGRCYYKQNNYELALKNYKLAMQIDSFENLFFSNVALVHYDRKEYEKAINYYSQSILLDDRDADSYYYRALSYKALKKFDLATKDFERAHIIDPSIKVSKELEDIKMNTFFNKQLFYILLIALFALIAILIVGISLAKRRNS
jgi:tetratricopeptide (TPR) repeat protein